jgi:hypothetical protein
MWRCSRCAAHVEDGLTVCPLCKAVAPERPAERSAVRIADIHDLVPETGHDPAMLPQRTEPDLERTDAAPLTGAGLVLGGAAGFLGGVGLVLANATGPWDDWMTLAVAGVVGVAGAILVGLLGAGFLGQVGILLTAAASLFRRHPDVDRALEENAEGRKKELHPAAPDMIRPAVDRVNEDARMTQGPGG